MSDFLKKFFEALKRSNMMINAMLVAKTKRLLGDETVKITLLRSMGLSSILSSETSYAILDKSLTLFNSRLLCL